MHASQSTELSTSAFKLAKFNKLGTTVMREISVQTCKKPAKIDRRKSGGLRGKNPRDTVDTVRIPVGV